MRIAIPEFHGRVSPVFDWSRRIVLIDLDGRVEIARERRTMVNASPETRIGRLTEASVDVLICGGITEEALAAAERVGLAVESWVAGEVDLVVEAFLNGKLRSSAFFAMPGCFGLKSDAKKDERKNAPGKDRAGKDGS